MTEKRFKLEVSDDWWRVIDNEVTLWKEEVVYLLNEQEETIERLKAIRGEQIEVILKQKGKIRELERRIERQYERLKEITDLMVERDWESLEEIVEEWEESDRLLQAEWSTYGDME